MLLWGLSENHRHANERPPMNATARHESSPMSSVDVVHVTRPGQGRRFEVYAYGDAGAPDARFEAVVRSEDGIIADRFPVSHEFYAAAADASALYAKAQHAIAALTYPLAREASNAINTAKVVK